MNFSITNEEARNFILYKNGLIGSYRYKGKKGITDYIRDVSVIQYDPVDVCGKSPEITLNSRVEGFNKDMFSELLYKDRAVFDYYDKQMSIILIEDWKYFNRTRQYYSDNVKNKEEISLLLSDVRNAIAQSGETSSKDLPLNHKVEWYWSATTASRAALETLYLQGELVVSRKKNAVKYYDLARRLIAKEHLIAPEPFTEDIEHYKWRILRRIKATGLLWNRPSDAFLGIDNMKAADRSKAFDQLLMEGNIYPVNVQGMDTQLFIHKDDVNLLEYTLSGAKLKPRCELLAPLDNLMWDRLLIEKLFSFKYRWEIYTPQNKRKYGYYVLPVIYGNKFIGRIELIRDTKNNLLHKKNFWQENGIRINKAMEKAMHKAITRLACMNGVAYGDENGEE